MENKKKLLSLNDVEIKFRVRGRTLTAIRKVNLDVYEGEALAIVGESGSGKSVLTKSFAGMLDSNGFVSSGSIIYDDEELSTTNAKKTFYNRMLFKYINRRLNKFSRYEDGSKIYMEIEALKKKILDDKGVSLEKFKEFDETYNDLLFTETEAFNKLQSLDKKVDIDLYNELKEVVKDSKEKKKNLLKQKKALVKANLREYRNNTNLVNKNKEQMTNLKSQYKEVIENAKCDNKLERNILLSKETILTVGRYPVFKKLKAIVSLLLVFKKAMKEGLDLENEDILDDLYLKVAFRVKYIDETNYPVVDGKKQPFINEKGKKVVPYWHGFCKLDLAKFKLNSDWQQIRGSRVATVFQDPMTSLNPIVTIGKQITDCILKHQNLTYDDAKKKAIELMDLVGIPNAENRFGDYPFQYSGGMRQRIVIAIALSCEPKILICDEPTTALDVTIQAQIIRLIKDLQKKLGFTIIFITHDLGVVANVADRVAVLYAGQVVEVATVEELFYDPRHPYTWSLLSSLPQLSTKGDELFSIPGTPPSLYNDINGDPFAPRNPYRMAIDFIKEPPMFKVSETHYAKTWLLDPRAPKVEAPEIIKNLHEKMSNTIYAESEVE